MEWSDEQNGAAENADKVCVEYSCNKEQYRRMRAAASVKAGIFVWVNFALILGILLSVVAVLVGDLKVGIVLAAAYVLVLALLALTTTRRVRATADRAFEMNSRDGLIRERLEIVGHTLSVTNLCTGSHSRLKFSVVGKVTMHKEYFAVALGTGAAKMVPLNAQTQVLAETLARPELLERAASANPERLPEQPVARPIDARSFEVEPTREQMAHIMRSYGLKRMGMTPVFFALCLVAGVALILFGTLADRADMWLWVAVGCFCIVAGVALCTVNLCSVHQGVLHGRAWFDTNSRDDRVLLRFELTQTGFAEVNVLCDYRAVFRFADVAQVVRAKDYFVVHLASGEVLPVALNAETSQLCDVLLAAKSNLRPYI